MQTFDITAYEHPVFVTYHRDTGRIEFTTRTNDFVNTLTKLEKRTPDHLDWTVGERADVLHCDTVTFDESGVPSFTYTGWELPA